MTHWMGVKICLQCHVTPVIVWQFLSRKHWGLFTWTIIALYLSHLLCLYFVSESFLYAVWNKSPHSCSLLLPQGGDDVMGCVHDDNGRVRIHHFYNVGQWAKEIKRNPARDEEGIFESNRVTCRFKRPLYVPREETLVDLHLSWYYLFAWGPAIQGDWSSFSFKSTVFFFFFVFHDVSRRLTFPNRFHHEAWHRQSAGQRPHDQYL